MAGTMVRTTRPGSIPSLLPSRACIGKSPMFQTSLSTRSVHKTRAPFVFRRVFSERKSGLDFVRLLRGEPRLAKGL
jgi:hypothetical protein